MSLRFLLFLYYLRTIIVIITPPVGRGQNGPTVVTACRKRRLKVKSNPLNNEDGDENSIKRKM